MKTENRLMNKAVLAGWLLGLASFAPTVIAQSPAAEYAGRWEIQANGDVQVTWTYKLPMQLYNEWKGTEQHMLLAREFSSQRSAFEVTDRKAVWDDMNQTLTMTMTVLGLCQNKGNHWEGQVRPGVEFSNLDDNRKMAYFHFSSQGEVGKVEGQDVVVFPPTTRKASWDKDRKVLVYELPPPGTAGIVAQELYWSSAIACVAAGCGLWVVSCRKKPQASPPTI